MTIEEKFARLGTDNAPGQEDLQKKDEALPMIGDKLEGPVVDFSHGDVNAHTPSPGSLETFVRHYAVDGTFQAYTEYREEVVQQAGSSIVGATMMLDGGVGGRVF